MKLITWLKKQADRRIVKSDWFWITAWAVLVIVASLISSPYYWDWLSAEESNSSTIRNIFLAAAALIALPLAIWRSTVAGRQADTAQQQSGIAQRGLLNERYQKGAEMLGSRVLSVRLGGIYALQSLASENPEQYHIQIMRLFCAFVRNLDGVQDGSLTPAIEIGSGGEEEGNDQTPRMREDVQAVMEAIGGRDEFGRRYLEKEDGVELYFGEANLSFLRLDNADLSNARFWKANLSGTSFSKANLSGTSFSKANLFGTSFSKANLSGAKLWKTSLSGATFTEAYLAATDFSQSTGLTQNQLAQACADPNSPPVLNGVFDAKTGEPVIWYGERVSYDDWEEKRWFEASIDTERRLAD